jgi:hypothetical protein
VTELTCEIEILEEHVGTEARIYNIYVHEWGTSLYERFIEENKDYLKELKDIESRLVLMATKYGVREDWLKHKEGPPNLNIVALYDRPDRKLRCYGILFGRALLIIGGGGVKPKTVRRFQESHKLTEENKMLQIISQTINRLLSTGEISWAANKMDFEGKLKFKITM